MSIAAATVTTDDLKTCRICKGKSGAEVREERTVCDVCLGLDRPKSDSIFTDCEISIVPSPGDVAETSAENTGADSDMAEWECPRCGEMTTGTKIGRNRTKVCSTCIKSKRTKSQKTFFAKIRDSAAPANESHAGKKSSDIIPPPVMEAAPDKPPATLLPMIPTEIIIPMSKYKSIHPEEHVLVRVLDEGGGPWLAIEGVDISNTYSSQDVDRNEHQFHIESQAQIDALAATLKHIWRQVKAAYAFDQERNVASSMGREGNPKASS
jgi:hypothetical protein